MVAFNPIASAPIAAVGGNGSTAFIDGVAVVSFAGKSTFAGNATIAGVAANSFSGIQAGLGSSGIEGIAAVSGTVLSTASGTGASASPAPGNVYAYGEVVRLFGFVDVLAFGDATGDISTLLSYPDGSISGDLAYLVISWDEEDGSDFSTPAGWDQVADYVDAKPRSVVYRRVIDSVSDDPVMVATGSRLGGGPVIFTFRGAQEFASDYTGSGTSDAITFPDATLPAGDRVIAGVGSTSGVQSDLTAVDLGSDFAIAGASYEASSGTVTPVASDASAWLFTGSPTGTGAYTMPVVTPAYDGATTDLDTRSYTITVEPEVRTSTGTGASVTAIPEVSGVVHLTRKVFGGSVIQLPVSNGSGTVLRAGRLIPEASAGPTAAIAIDGLNATTERNSRNSVVSVPIDTTRIT